MANKVITLNGEVPTLAAKKRATIEAKKVEEDYTIQNNLKVSYEKISDEKLAQEVRNRIDNYMFYTVFDWVTVDVNNGVVTLNGYVHLPWSSDQIATLVENMDGVQKVVNNLQKVISSDELRYQAARAIYTDWRFYYHALDKDPPIHIIVDGPNIILEGTVDNESDKSWAGALINFNTNALQVQNDLKVVKG